MARAVRGFTLIEMVVTVAIVGILAAMAMPLVEMTVKRGKEQELRRALREIRWGIDYYNEIYLYSCDKTLQSGSTPGLNGVNGAGGVLGGAGGFGTSGGLGGAGALGGAGGMGVGGGLGAAGLAAAAANGLGAPQGGSQGGGNQSSPFGLSQSGASSSAAQGSGATGGPDGATALGAGSGASSFGTTVGGRGGGLNSVDASTVGTIGGPPGGAGVAARKPKMECPQGATGYPKSLQVLVEGVNDVTNPLPGAKIYFLRRIPRDPLNSDFSVSDSESWGLRSSASPPDEPEDGDDVFDVYTKDSGKDINGIPYRDW